MNPEGLMPSYIISRSEKDKYGMVSLTCGIGRKKASSETRSRVVVPGAGARGLTEKLMERVQTELYDE